MAKLPTLECTSKGHIVLGGDQKVFVMVVPPLICGSYGMPYSTSQIFLHHFHKDLVVSPKDKDPMVNQSSDPLLCTQCGDLG